MESAPPSYQASTVVDPWDIIGRYIPSSDLCSSALVCSRWHTTFAPHLWGNPTSHFGIENDRVYVALTKFKRTLRTARLLVRALTHTVHLPPAHAELYNGPHSDWLRDILERLPNLQSLIVRGLPFFDHSALWALKYKPPKPSIDDDIEEAAVELPGSSGRSFQRPFEFIPSFGLRLIDASRCPNVTSTSLAQALGRFENLMYLDLSFTYPARDAVVLSTLRRFTGLQVLKMRGASLTDDHISILAAAIAKRVRSLDIRDNYITDRGIRTLLDECFIVVSESNDNSLSGQRSPALIPYIGSEMLGIYQGEDFESFLRNAFTGRFIGRLAIEDAPEGGITHLYAAGNQLSVEGVSGLLRSRRLHVLDVETVATAVGRPLSITSDQAADSWLSMPGAEKLAAVVNQYASDSLTFLRIDHAIVTKDSTDPLQTQEAVVQGRVELDDTALPDVPSDAAELEATTFQPNRFELPESRTPRYELAADPVHVVVSHAINDHQHTDEETLPPYSGPRRGSAFAPEVVDTLAADTDTLEPLSPLSVSTMGEDTLMTGTLLSTLSPLASPVSPIFPPTPPSTSAAATSTLQRPRSYCSMDTERKARLNAHMASSHGLHPAMVPRVRTLVLTDVPPSSPSKVVSDRLIGFIKQCAQEASLARIHAKLDYALPPGKGRHATTLKQSADRNFAMKRLVLELAPENNTRRSSKASPWVHSNTRSMTEDRDSEALWSAAETDFSFFGDEDYSFPSLDSGRYAYPQGSMEKEMCMNKAPSQSSTPKPAALPSYDTVALISAFRKDRRLAHQRSIAAGAVDPETEGYWEGVVQVVKPGNSTRPDEEIDYYGNRFEAGYLYR